MDTNRVPLGNPKAPLELYMFTGLTAELCNKALEIVRPTIEAAMENGTFKRKQGYLFVLDPTIPWEPKYQDVGNKADSPFNTDVILFQESWEDSRRWDAPFGVVAIQKAFASWKTGLSAQDIQQKAPYLYQRGWTKWGGSSVGEGGLVVAFSGVQAYYDQMISEMMLAAIRAVCLHEMHSENGVMSDPAITYLGIMDRSDPPFCMQCGVEMVRAGSLHACPSCGTTG